MSTAFDAEHFLASAPTAPGVYAMLDAGGAHLYVGKARNLKKRLTSYFRKSGLPVKTRAMMRRVAAIRTTVTHTESEALLLENNLIKSERPRYNIVLRDDKSYPYIWLAAEHEFPRLSFYRGSRKESGRFFGPFPSAAAVRETLSQLQKVFPVRQCEDSFFRNRSRPCLQYQIERCTAPCVGLIDAQSYAEDVQQAVLFLEGKDRTLTERLVERMEAAAECLDYETAAQYRDRVAALRRIQERQYVSTAGGDADVVALASDEGQACIEVVFIRNGRNIGAKDFFPESALGESPAEILAAFLPQYYLGKPVPAEILLSHAVAGVRLLEETFARQAGHRVHIKSAARGHRARWLERTAVNAADVLRRHLAGRAAQGRRLEALREALDLEALPGRIECFDVSHTMGEGAVAACVVFDADGPVKSDYRRFNIADITPGDDYAALAQALTRRYRRLKEGEGRLPDLLFIDGGKGQVGAAQGVLDELQVEGVKLVGVAKGRARKPGQERLFLAAAGRARVLDPASPALHLVQQVRDEAHRFAITGHRQRRGRARVTSRLQHIAGVGDKRRQALLKHLGGLREVSRAGVDDLARVPGISPRLAARIYAELHDEES